MDGKILILTTVIGAGALFFTVERKKHKPKQESSITKEAENLLDSLKQENTALASQVRHECDSLKEVKQKIKWRIKVIEVAPKDSL